MCAIVIIYLVPIVGDPFYIVDALLLIPIIPQVVHCSLLSRRCCCLMFDSSWFLIVPFQCWPFPILIVSFSCCSLPPPLLHTLVVFVTVPWCSVCCCSFVGGFHSHCWLLLLLLFPRPIPVVPLFDSFCSFVTPTFILRWHYIDLLRPLQSVGTCSPLDVVLLFVVVGVPIYRSVPSVVLLRWTTLFPVTGGTLHSQLGNIFWWWPVQWWNVIFRTDCYRWFSPGWRFGVVQAHSIPVMNVGVGSVLFSSQWWLTVLFWCQYCSVTLFIIVRCFRFLGRFPIRHSLFVLLLNRKVEFVGDC